jgi:hypothetical protein
MADFTLEAGLAPRLRDALAGVDSTVAATFGGLTATAEELNCNDGSVAGTAVASKALVLGADKNVDVLAVADLKLGAAAGTSVIATAAELNAMCDVSHGTYAAKLIACALNATCNAAITAATGPITPNGITVIGHATELTAATLAAPALGAKIVVCSGSAYAHTVTVTEPVHFKGCGSDGTKHIATFHNTGDESFTAVYESATVWRVIDVNGVTFS